MAEAGKGDGLFGSLKRLVTRSRTPAPLPPAVEIGVPLVTEEQLVAEKTRGWEKPSDTLRFSMQVLVCNEMPTSEYQRRANPHGNVSDFLDSVFTAAEAYQEKGGNPQDIEVLLNVNNPTMYKDGTVGNRRAIELAQAITTSREVDDANIAETVANLSWFGDTSIPPESHDESVTFFSNLIRKGRTLHNQGLQLHVADCTDGSFIQQSTDGKTTLKATQGARRRLLGSIAKDRFNQAKKTPFQLHCGFDADMKLEPNFFSFYANEYSQPGTAETVIVTSPHITIDPEADPSWQNTTPIQRTRLALIESLYTLADFSQDTASQKFTPYMGSFPVPQKLYEKIEQWDITKNEFDDANMAAQVTAATQVRKHAISVTEIKDSPGAWFGKTREFNPVDLPKLEFHPTGWLNAIRKVNRNLTIWQTGIVVDEHSPAEVVQKLWQAATIQEGVLSQLSQEETSLIAEISATSLTKPALTFTEEEMRVLPQEFISYIAQLDQTYEAACKLNSLLNTLTSRTAAQKYPHLRKFFQEISPMFTMGIEETISEAANTSLAKAPLVIVQGEKY